MSNLLFRGLAAALLLAAGAVPSGAAVPAPLPAHPAALILDTDIGNDSDDVMALAVVHALQSRNECRLLAVTLTNSDPLAGELVDAIDTFYGRGEIPIGVNPAAPRVHQVSRYLKAARDFPHDFDARQAPSAVGLMRRTLAAAPDRSVTIVQIGFFTNLAALLESTPDQDSELPGLALVERKVRRVSLMAGAFGAAAVSSHYSEFNVRYDKQAAAKVAGAWPTPMVWSGFEIGQAVPFPAVSIERDFNYVRRHPVRECYQLFRPTPHERPCYDPTAVLEAVRPDRGYFELSAPGRVEIKADGFAQFTPTPGGRDRYLILGPGNAGRLRTLFSVLVSEPPARSPAPAAALH